MHTKISFFTILLALGIAINASASFKYGEKVTIAHIAMWEDSNVHPLYFKTSAGVWCYVPASEERVASLVLTLYASGKKADIHCHETAEQKMGGIEPAHKIHRIIAE